MYNCNIIKSIKNLGSTVTVGGQVFTQNTLTIPPLSWWLTTDCFKLHSLGNLEYSLADASKVVSTGNTDSPNVDCVANSHDYFCKYWDILNNLNVDLASKISTSASGAVNGVCPLDASGKIPISYAPTSLLGAMKFQGTWDSTSNTLTALVTAQESIATGSSKGMYWVVSVAGSTTMGSYNEWKPKDWIIYNGSSWDKIDNTETALVQGSSAVTTGAIAWDLLASQRLDLNTALTGAINITLTNPQVPSTNYLSLKQGASVQAITLTGSGVTFYQDGSTTSGVGSIALTNNMMISNAPYVLQLNWVSGTVCYVDCLTRKDANKANLASPIFTGTPTLPTGAIGVTQAVGTSGTSLATTQFVQQAIGNTITKLATISLTATEALCTAIVWTGAVGTLTMPTTSRGYVIVNNGTGIVTIQSTTATSTVSVPIGYSYFVWVLDSANVKMEGTNWANLAGVPTTLLGYGITDAVSSSYGAVRTAEFIKGDGVATSFICTHGWNSAKRPIVSAVDSTGSVVIPKTIVRTDANNCTITVNGTAPTANNIIFYLTEVK